MAQDTSAAYDWLEFALWMFTSLHCVFDAPVRAATGLGRRAGSDKMESKF